MRIQCLIAFLTLLLLSACAGGPDVRSAQDFYKEGETYYSKKNYEDAVSFYKKAKETYSSPEMTSLAELRIADAHFAAEKFIESAAAYDEFIKAHPQHDQAAYALYRKGLSHYKMIEGIDLDQTPVSNAVEIFTQYLRKYPTKEQAKEVQGLLDTCRFKQLQYEIYVGRHYLRADKYLAAVNRLEKALKRFPESSAHDETLYYLGQAYFKQGEKTKGREIFQRLGRDFPDSDLLMKAAAFLENVY